MSVSRADRRFWVVTLAAVLACALTASLGFWQLRRADLKNSLQAAIAERATLPELTNRDLQGVADSRPVLHRKAGQLRGRGQVDAQRILPPVKPFDIGTVQRVGGKQPGVVYQHVNRAAAAFQRLFPQMLRCAGVEKIGGKDIAIIPAGARRLPDHMGTACFQRGSGCCPDSS